MDELHLPHLVAAPESQTSEREGESQCGCAKERGCRQGKSSSTTYIASREALTCCKLLRKRQLRYLAQ